MEEYPSLVEGTGLENREVEKSAQGFESLFLRHFLLSRNRAIWQLVGLITQRLLVQIHLPQPMVRWCSGYHARLSRERSWVQVPYEPPCGFIAQLAEHKTENLGVVGSIPTEATIFNFRLRRLYNLRSQLNWIEHLTTDQKVRGSTPLGRTSYCREVAQLGRAFGLGPRGCRFKSCLPDHLKINLNFSNFNT